MRDGLTQAHFPFVARLNAASRRELAAFSTTRVKPSQRLLARGDAVDGAYLVVGGSLRVYYISSSGREATLYRVEPGGTCVLALTAAFNREPYPAWVDAGGAGCAFVRVPEAAFRRLFDEEPGFREFLFAVLSGRVFELMQLLEETGSAQIEQRVARYLVRRANPDGMVRASQFGIASELGTAREVVYRALRSLAARGLVKTGRARIEILDRLALRRIAGG
jgi:CRP/FNR family transcriptional regulator